jgi:hypothetical protein
VIVLYFVFMANLPSSQRKRLKRIVIIATLLFLAVIAGAWWFLGSESAAIDYCLDSGGRWAEGGYCEGARYGG